MTPPQKLQLLARRPLGVEGHIPSPTRCPGSSKVGSISTKGHDGLGDREISISAVAGSIARDSFLTIDQWRSRVSSPTSSSQTVFFGNTPVMNLLEESRRFGQVRSWSITEEYHVWCRSPEHVEHRHSGKRLERRCERWVCTVSDAPRPVGGVMPLLLRRGCRTWQHAGTLSEV